MSRFGRVAAHKPEIYGHERKPHTGLGMVGLVIVGDPSANLGAAKGATSRGKARERLEALLTQVDG